MAFDLQSFGRSTSTYNSPVVTLQDSTVQGVNSEWSYRSAVDTVAQIATSGYFNSQYQTLNVNDLFFIVGSDASAFYTVASITNGVVALSSFATSSPVGTANIDDLAVTTAKIADAAVTSAKLGAGAVLSAAVSPLLLQYASVAINNAGTLGLFGTPVSLVAAPGAGTAVIVHRLSVEHVFATAAFAAGGNIYAQYGATAHGTNVASATIAPTGLMDQSASTVSAAAGSLTGLAETVVANAAVTLTNATAAFTTGGGSLVAKIWYSVVAV